MTSPLPDLPTHALDYPLDPAHVADRPAEPRDSARLMVVHRATHQVEHATVRDLPNWLRPHDHLVLNRTRVLRARFVGQRRSATAGEHGRATEGLLLEAHADGVWTALVRQAKRFRLGDALDLTGHDGRTHGDWLEFIERADEAWLVRLHAAGGAPWHVALERSGWTPLPPYIVRARAQRHHTQTDDQDRAWYQTVYAAMPSADLAAAHPSVAAPTAGLHFTPALLDRVASMGVRTLEVTLQVGAGTFKPVEAATLSAHAMHSEWCHVPHATLAALHALAPARAAGQARLVVVGTTSVRTLESLPRPLPTPDSCPQGWTADTRLLIQPGHAFQHVDALLTNFHLPRSTLLALVGALTGLDWLKELYALAQHKGYRFFSYGDAMLVL